MTLKQFSKELKETREKAGITLQKIAAKTRIDIKFLNSIEEGDFSFLPDLYVKAFIKQYAKVVGLDEDITLQNYFDAKEIKNEERTVEKPPAQKKDTTAEIVKKEETGESKETIKSFDDSAKEEEGTGAPRNLNSLVIGGSVVGATVVLLLIYLIFFNSSSNIIVEEKPYDEVLQESPKRFVEKENETDNQTKNLPVIEAMKLNISNTDSTDSAWVFVVIDDTTSAEFLLLPSISRSVSGNNNFQITLGNSGVIKMKLDDKDVTFDGRRGVVRYFKIDRNGLQRIYSPPQISR